MASFPRDRAADIDPSVVQPWLDEALSRFRENLGTLLGECEYTTEDFAADLPLVMSLAEQGVPPAERLVAFEDEDAADDGPDAPGDPNWSRPIDWRSILNGMFFRYLSDVGFPAVTLGQDRTGGQARSEARRRAILTTVGAIELSEFHRRATLLRRQFDRVRPINHATRGEPF